MFTATSKINQSFLRIVFSLLLSLVVFGAWAQPTFNSAEIRDDFPRWILVTFNVSGGNMTTGDLGTGFTVRVNGAAATISNVLYLNSQSVPADQMWFQISTPVDASDVVTVEYDDSGDTRDAISGFQLAAFGAQGVTNNVTPLTFTPTNGSTEISPGTNLVLDFNGTNVQAGTGDITISPIGTLDPDITIGVGSAAVTIVNDVVTINPTADFNPNTLYEVTFGVGTFQATSSGENLAGIISNEWRFTTGANLSITAPSLTNICSGTTTYFDLGNIVINEGSASHFATGAGQTLVLAAPTGFEFEAGVGNAPVPNGSDLTGSPTMVVATNQITVTYDVSAEANVNTLTLSGIRVRATTTSTSGNITRSGGSANQVGNTVGDALVHASLSSNANTCPEVTTYTPTKLATNVGVGDNIVLDFNTNVVAGTGNITITPLSPAGTDIVIPIGDARVAIGGGSSTVTIDHSSDLASFTQYEVKIAAGAIIGDGSGLSFDGITAGEWTFTTGDLTLALASTSPVDNAVDIAKGTNIVLTYNTNIAEGTGNITIRNVSDMTNEYVIPIGDAQVTISGNTVTINPSTDLNANKLYRVTMDAGAVLRASDNAAGPALTGGELTFETAITLASLSPVNGTTDVATNSTFTITYDAEVINATGGSVPDIIIRDVSGAVADITVDSSTLNYSGTNTAVIPAQSLLPNKQYDIIVPAGAIVGDGGATADAPAIAAAAWRITTASSTAVTSTSPAHNATGVTAGTTSISVTFDEDIRIGSGNITIFNTTTSTNHQVIDVTGGAVVIDGTNRTATITVSALTANRTYQVTIDKGAFENLAAPNAEVPSLAGANWEFTTESAVTIASISPADDVIGVATNSDLVITVSGGTVAAGSGDIVIRNITDGGTQNVAIGSASISGGGTVVTIPNSTFTLLDNAEYRVTFNDGVLVDAESPGEGVPVDGITNINGWNFTTDPGITGTPTTPTNGAINVGVSTNPLITYSGAIQKGVAGKNVTIHKLTAPTSSTVLDITDASITITGASNNQLLITLSDFELGSQYEVIIDDGALLAANRAQAEIEGVATNEWRFTTVNGVAITAPAVTTCIGGDFVDMDPIVIAESSTSSFSVGTTQQLVLRVPTNYEMETGAGTVIVTGTEITNASLVIATNTITVQYDITGVGNINSIIISGLKIKANTLGAGSITYDASSTALQQGNTTGMVHATLTSDPLPANPTLSQTAVSFCENTDISSQTITASGAFMVRWYSDAALNNLLYTGITANIQTNLGVNSADVGTSTFYVTRDNGTCEGGATTLTVTINPLPVVNLISSDADNTICAGESVTFTAIATPNTSANYIFRNGSTVLQNSASNVYTSTALASGSITVEVTVSGCATTSSPAINFTVNPLPNVGYISASTTSFPNDQTTPFALTDGSTYGATLGGTIQATTVGSYSGPGVISNNFYPDVAGDGTHTITYDYTDGNGCAASTTFTLSVFNPAGAIQNLNNTYCLNDPQSPVLIPTTNTDIFPNKIRVSTPFGNVVYDKTSNFTIAGIGIVGGPPYNFDPNTAGSRKIDITVNYIKTKDPFPGSPFPNNNSQTRTVTVDVRELPSVTLEGLDPEYCADVTSVTLNPLAGSGSLSSGFTVKYTKDGGTEQSLAANTKVINPAVLGAGTYSMYFTYSDGFCSNDSPPVTFDILALPNPDFTFPVGATSYSVCVDQAGVVLSPTDGGAAITGTDLSRVVFEVQTNKTGNYEPLAAGQTTIVPSNLGTGTHNIRLTYTNANGCKITTTTPLELTINALPIPLFASGLTTDSYCVSVNAVTIVPQNNTVNITGTDLNNNVVMSIDQGADGSFVDQTTGDVTFDPSTLGVGTHQIKFRYTNSDGCVAESGVKTIVVFPLPAPNFAESNLVYCADVNTATITLRDGTNNLVTTQLNNANILVRTNSTGIFDTPPVGSVTKTVATSTVTIDPSVLGATVAGFPHQIQFTYTDGNSCVATSPVLEVTVNALPAPNISFVGASRFCINAGNQEIDVRDATSPLTAAQLANVTFEIDKGSGYAANSGEVIIDFVNAKVYVVPSLMGDGNHDIRMTYTNDNGCVDITGDLNFTVDPEPIPVISGIPAGGYCVNVNSSTISLLDNITPLTATQLSGGRVTFELNKNAAGFVAASATEVSISGSTVSIHPNVIGEGSHQLRFTYQDDNNCTTISGEESFTVYPLPVLSFTGLDATYCFGASNVLLQAFDGADNLLNNLANVDFFISSNNGASFSAAPTSVIEVDATVAKTITFKPAGLPAGTDYQLKFEYTDANTCKTESGAIPFVIHPLPQPTITIVGGATAYCETDGTAQLRLSDLTTGTNLNNNAGGRVEPNCF